MRAQGREAATKSQRHRRDALLEMARRGTEHEAAVARAKLARIEARYDFSAAAAEETGKDIFRDWRPVKAGGTRRILRMDGCDRDIGSVVKWILGGRLGVVTTWRHGDGHAELLAGLDAGDAPRVAAFAKSLHRAISGVCGGFFGKTHPGELARAPFLAGLLEGILDEPRTEGRIVPGASPLARKKPARKKSARKNAASSGAAALHPYDQGREIGRLIRLSVPARELRAQIRLSKSPGDAGRREDR